MKGGWAGWPTSWVPHSSQSHRDEWGMLPRPSTGASHIPGYFPRKIKIKSIES